MNYFYLSKEALKRNEIVVYDVFSQEIDIRAYQTGNGKEDAIQYIGENIPNDLIYDYENDVVFSEADRPSPYHIFVKGAWVVKDRDNFYKYRNETIDEIKKEILNYGFDYEVKGQHHRQRCRDKDIAYMVANIVALQVAEKMGVNKKITWYFEDNIGMEAGVQELGLLMLYGTTFVQSVFDTENYFKMLEDMELVSKEKFENKRKEIHKDLVGK